MKTCWVCKCEKEDKSFSNKRAAKCRECTQLHREMHRRGEYVPTMTRPEQGKKLCSVCKAVKALNEFYISRGIYTSYCKECDRAKAREAKRSHAKQTPRQRFLTELKRQAPPKEAIEYYAGWQMKQPTWVDPSWI
jgi:hypothetical protein